MTTLSPESGLCCIATAGDYTGDNMSKLLPKSWEIESPLSVDDLVKGIAPRLELARSFRWGRNSTDKPLQGAVFPSGFLINRVAYHSFRRPYYPWYRPMLKGTFIPHDNGTTIRVRMEFDLIVRAVIIAIHCINGLLLIGGLVAAVETGTWGLLVGQTLLSGIVLLLAWWLPVMEGSEVKRLLSQMLAEVHEEAAGREVLTNTRRSTPPPLPDQSESVSGTSGDAAREN